MPCGDCSCCGDCRRWTLPRSAPCWATWRLGFSALHALYANRTLLPKELQPHWLLQVGVLLCGIFFIGISTIVAADLARTIQLF